MNTLKLTRGRYLMVLLAMCGLVASSIGIMTNTAGLFFKPIAEELGKETAAVNLTLTISNLAFAFAGLAAARFIGPKNFKPMLLVCTILSAGSTAALALCRSLPPLYALNAVRGFASGMIGSVLATTVLGYWFRTDTGLISSLALGCSGLIGALFNPILEAVMTAASWRTAYLVAAATVAVLNLPALLLPITFRPMEQKLEPLQARPKAAGSAKPVREPRSGNAKSVWVIVFAACVCAFGSFVAATPQMFKSLAASIDLEETGVIMATVAMIANIAGKFVFGWLTDRIGVKLSTLIWGTLVAGGVLLLTLVHVPAVMLVSAAMIGLIYSIPTVGAVMICRELFSPDRYTQVYPKLALAASAVNAIGYPIIGAIYDATGSYTGGLILVFALMIAAMASVIAVYRIADREIAAEAGKA